MNDSINIKIGAEDTGFESALKTVQAELSRLEGKVQAGDMTFKELDKTMKEIGKVQALEARLKSIGDASAESSPKIQNLGNDIASAGDKAKSAGGIFDAEFQKIAGAFTVGNLAAQGFQKVLELAFDAARAVVQGFSDALDLGGRLNELSSRTGEAAGKLLVLETAFKNSGLEASQVGTAINKLQNFMQDAANGGEKQRAAMQALGISMADLAGKTPTEQMQVFADKIAGIEDPTKRAAAASEVFGDKFGGKLLPLFTDFRTNLDDARSKLGSLEEVMDKNAATFDAAAETIEAVKGKMAAFAAGVLGETIPALQDLGKSMEEVDAAGLGQEVGEFLSPRLEKLSFVTLGASEAIKDLIDLLSTGPSNTSPFGQAINAVADSLNGFNYYMQQAVNFLSPMDDLWTILEQKGRAAAESQDTAAKSIAGTGTAAHEAATGLQNVGTASEIASGKVDALGISAQNTGQNIENAFTITSDFAPKIDGIIGSWSGLNEQILSGKNLLTENYNIADSMTGKIEEQTSGFGGINEQLNTSNELASLIDTTYGKHAEKLAEIQAKQDAIAAKEAEKHALMQESLNLDLGIAEAKANGDAELVKTLENQKLFNAELQKAIDAGMGEPQAAAFAQQMVNAKNAASLVNVNTSTITEAKKEAEKAATAAQSFATWLDYIKGIDPSQGVKSAKEQAAEARKEITAFGEYIGKDLKNKSYPDIARELGISTLGMTGKEQMEAILSFISSKRAELTGIKPIDESGTKASIENIESKVRELGKTPQTITLDASKSIENIKNEFKKNIDLAITTGEGSKILGEIKTFVSEIKTLVGKIEPKLPVAALTA